MWSTDFCVGFTLSQLDLHFLPPRLSPTRTSHPRLDKGTELRDGHRLPRRVFWCAMGGDVAHRSDCLAQHHGATRHLLRKCRHLLDCQRLCHSPDGYRYVSHSFHSVITQILLSRSVHFQFYGQTTRFDSFVLCALCLSSASVSFVWQDIVATVVTLAGLIIYRLKPETVADPADPPSPDSRLQEDY